MLVSSSDPANKHSNICENVKAPPPQLLLQFCTVPTFPHKQEHSHTRAEGSCHKDADM